MITKRIQAFLERLFGFAEMKFRAFHDALTGLPNRAFLEHHAHEHFQQRNPRQLALLFIDIDKFKKINDHLGHQLGDQLLQKVGKRFRDAVRKDDFVARFGGDEFMVLAKIASSEDAKLLAESIFKSLRDDFIIGQHNIYVTASIGIAPCIRRTAMISAR